MLYFIHNSIERPFKRIQKFNDVPHSLCFILIKRYDRPFTLKQASLVKSKMSKSYEFNFQNTEICEYPNPKSIQKRNISITSGLDLQNIKNLFKILNVTRILFTEQMRDTRDKTPVSSMFHSIIIIKLWEYNVSY